MSARERIRAKQRVRLARMRPNSGHAKVLRAKLGITDAPEAPEPTPVPEVVEQPKKKGRSAKKK
jgi:hypothetical protein